MGEEPSRGIRPTPKSRILRISARTRQAIAIDVINSELKEGYLPRLNTKSGVYIGKAAVSENGQGRCHVLAINTLVKNIDIEIEPQELIPFEYHHFHEDRNDSDSGNNISIDRVVEIVKRLRLDHLSDEEMNHIIDLVEEFPDRFNLPSDHLEANPCITHKIPTIDNVPINTRQYRFPPVHKEEIERQVADKLEKGIITPSNSPYNSPLWIVLKKPDSKGNTRWRMVIDFRKKKLCKKQKFSFT